MFTNTLLLLIFGLASLILVAGSALPNELIVERREMLTKRDVWSPRIFSPKEGTVWRAGEVVKVTWYEYLAMVISKDVSDIIDIAIGTQNTHRSMLRTRMECLFCALQTDSCRDLVDSPSLSLPTSRFMLAK